MKVGVGVKAGLKVGWPPDRAPAIAGVVVARPWYGLGLELGLRLGLRLGLGLGLGLGMGLGLGLRLGMRVRVRGSLRAVGVTDGVDHAHVQLRAAQKGPERAAELSAVHRAHLG